MRSIKIYYPDQAKGALVMQFSNTMPEASVGTDVLLEKVAKLLLTAPKSNYFSPDLGSQIGNVSTLTFTNSAQVQVALSNAVSTVQDAILAEQANLVNVPTNQLLDHLQISQIFQDSADPTYWHLEVLVYNQRNQSYYLTV